MRRMRSNVCGFPISEQQMFQIYSPKKEIIRKTCPCNEYPFIPYFRIVKLGYAGVYLFFLFLLQIQISSERINEKGDGPYRGFDYKIVSSVTL